VGSKEVEVVVDDFGNVAFVHDDDLAELLAPLFDLRTRRASRVEPVSGTGLWAVDVSPLLGASCPKVVGVFARRDLALAQELRWVRDYLNGQSQGDADAKLGVPEV
jgi:hypothetical protein